MGRGSSYPFWLASRSMRRTMLFQNLWSTKVARNWLQIITPQSTSEQSEGSFQGIKHEYWYNYILYSGWWDSFSASGLPDCELLELLSPRAKLATLAWFHFAELFNRTAQGLTKNLVGSRKKASFLCGAHWEVVNYAFDSAAHTASGCGGSRFFSPFQIQLVQSIICTLLQLRGSEHFAAHPLGTLRYFFALVQTARMSTTGKVKKRIVSGGPKWSHSINFRNDS